MADCIPQGGDGYERYRQIQNARFDLFPNQICRCETVAQVQDALARARGKMQLRVRAGGHHHEGMCSGDGVLMLDVSPMTRITIDNERTMVWAGPGAKNGDIYQSLWDAQARQVFSGGGCGDVRVGGFLQGAGWGPYARALGMGCDRLLSFHIVLANGDELDVTNDPNDPHKYLYWAVCGGGGGNFGVVTEYRIKTSRIGAQLSQFSVSWTQLNLRKQVIEEWRKNAPDLIDTRLTSFCRISTRDLAKDPPMLVSGFCMASEGETAYLLERMLPGTYSLATGIDIKPVHQQAKAAYAHPDYQPGPPPEAAAQVPGWTPPDLTETCTVRPYPHKISSCFPSANFDGATIDRILDFIDRSGQEANARRYLSLHGMGGEIRNNTEGSSFFWRQKPFMLQYQAWWADKYDLKLQGRCIDWIRNFRNTVQRDPRNPLRIDTEGSFINFPDHEIPLDQYYGTYYGNLIDIKRHYDPTNVFRFEMGIPTSR